MDLVSIIVPAYNSEKHLEKTLLSLVKQTYKNIEIIVVNDGSVDQTEQIIDSFTNRYPFIVKVNTSHRGVSVAREIGLAESHGIFIAFSDSDDFCEAEMIEKLVDCIHLTNADVVCSRIRNINPYGMVIQEETSGRLAVLSNVEAEYKLIEDSGINPSLCGKLYRSETIRKVMNEYKPEVEKIMYSEDLLLNFLIFSTVNQVSLLPDELYWYISRANSATRNESNILKYSDPLQVTEIIMANCNDDKIKKSLYSRRIRILGEGVRQEINLSFQKQCQSILRNEFLYNRIMFKSLPFLLKTISTVGAYNSTSLRIIRKLQDYLRRTNARRLR